MDDQSVIYIVNHSLFACLNMALLLLVGLWMAQQNSIPNKRQVKEFQH